VGAMARLVAGRGRVPLLRWDRRRAIDRIAEREDFFTLQRALVTIACA